MCQFAHLWCDAALRIDKVLKSKGWQDRDDDPFAQAEPALAELWKAALLGRPIDDSVALKNKAQLRGLPRSQGRNCAQMDGFSLHANTFVGPAARDELYKLVNSHSRRDIESRLARFAHRGSPSLPSQHRRQARN